jgi:thioredoxin 1
VSLAHLKKIIAEYPGVFVDFWSETCPPCRRIKPVFENMAKMNENENIAFCAVNTRQARDAAAAYQVSAIPNFICFVNGQQKANFKGANESRLYQEMAALQE